MVQRTCAVDDCEVRHYCKGFCNLHYVRMRTRGTTDAPIRKNPPRLRKGDDRTLVKTCPTCGDEFTIQRGRGSSRKKYCGPGCQQVFHNSATYPPCQVKDGDEICGRPWRSLGVGMCAVHYQRKIKHGKVDLRRRLPTGRCLQCDVSLTPAQRFYCSEDCGYLNRNGYEPKAQRECFGCGALLDEASSRKRLYCNARCRTLTARFIRYGVTAEESRALRRVTACQLCGKQDELVVDHRHGDGSYRGLLCHQCNVGIGMFQDDQRLLLQAIEYLKR